MKKLLVGSAVALAFAAGAEDMFVTPSTRATLAVESDAVQADRITVGSGGAVRKTGAGKWTLPLSRLAQGWDANLEIAEGALDLQADAAQAFQYADVSNALQKATVWLDASYAPSRVTDTVGRLTDWLDVRETGNETAGYALTRAVPNHAITPLSPIYQTSERYGKAGLYFHGYGNGCWVDFKTPAGADICYKVYHAFIIHGVEMEKGYPTPFGVRNKFVDADLFAFCPAGQGPSNYAIWSTYIRSGIFPVYNARTYVNGGQVDPFEAVPSEKNMVPRGFSLFETEMLNQPGIISCLENDRDYVTREIPGMNYSQYAGYNRQGADYVCEVLLYTNRLTTAERMKVESYLMNKWLGAQTPSAVHVTLASGTQMNLPNLASVAVSAEGTGALVKNEDDDREIQLYGFMGSLRLAAGGMTLNAAVPLSIAGGEKVEATTPYDGPHYAHSSGEKAEVFEKDGTGTLSADEVDPAVERIKVNAGTLALSAKTRRGSTFEPDTGLVYGTIPNASFEERMGSTQYSDIANGGVLNNWHASISSGQVFFWNGTVNPGTGRSTSTWKLPPTAPDGVAALAIKQQAAAWTEVTVPEDGVYELSFRGSCRKDYIGLPLLVQIGTDAESLTTIGQFRCLANAHQYYHYRYRTPELKAGTTYQLWFRAIENAADKCTLIDDLKLVKDESLSRTGVWRIPYGDFSDISCDYAIFPDANTYKFQAANAAALVGWTCVQPNPVVETTGTFSGVVPCALATRRGTATTSTSDGCYYNNRYEDSFAGVQLQLCQNGSASTTFTPPKGIFLLRGHLAMMPINGNSSRCVAFHASITPDGGEKVDLGAVERIYSTEMKRDVFPNAFESDGVTPVTLKLWVNGVSPSLLADANGNVVGLELVAAENLGGQNLVENGEFESMSGWTIEKFNATYYPERYTSNNDTAWGASRYRGSANNLKMTGPGVVSRSITIPAAGVYRFQAAARCRFYAAATSVKSGATDWGPNEIRFWLARNGETNEICNVLPSCTNFYESAASFRVDAPGEYTLGIEGIPPPNKHTNPMDMTSFVDGVQIVPVTFTEETPGLSEHTRITVAAGAKLRLDFPGTNQVSSLHLGGKAYFGTVTAETAPDYISGPGALTVVPDSGLFIILK